MSERKADDMREHAQWWWDEAARYAEIGARGLNAFAIDRAIALTVHAAETEARQACPSPAGLTA